MNQMSLTAPTEELHLTTIARDKKRGILLRAAQIGGSQIIRRAARFVFLFVVARRMGPESFGLYAILLAMVETLSLISGEGLIDFLAREVSKNPQKARHLYGHVARLRLGYACIVLPFGLLVLFLLKYPYGVLAAAFWMFLILFVRAPLAAGQGVLRAANRVSPLAWLEFTQGAVLLLALMPLLQGSMSLQSVAVVELLSTCAGAAASRWFLRNLPRDSGSPRVSWRQLIRSTATFNLYPLITNIYDRIDLLLLAVLAGNSAAGIYALPYRMLSLIQIVPFGLMTALLPMMASSKQSDADKNLCREISTALFALSLFPVLIAMLLADPLVSFVLGQSYLEAAPVLKLLVWAAIPMFINFGLNNFLLARGQEQVFVRTTLICAVLNFACNALSIPHFSYYAASVVTAVTESVLLIQNVAIIRNRYGFFPVSNRILLIAVAFTVVLGAAMAGSLYVPQIVLAVAATAILGFYVYRVGALSSVFRWMSPETLAT
jgi:O-antigen/teichoic acid export membrane protein